MDPLEFAAVIKGNSDDQIYEALAALRTGLSNDVEGLIDDVASSMVAAFDPNSAAGQSAVIQYDITTPEGPFSFQLLVKDGTCTKTRDCNEKPRVYLSLSLPNFLRLVVGALNGQQAYFSGALKVGGDIVFAIQLENWFKRPR
jgi:putative sterol carrier protein